MDWHSSVDLSHIKSGQLSMRLSDVLSLHASAWDGSLGARSVADHGTHLEKRIRSIRSISYGQSSTTQAAKKYRN